MDGLLLPSMGEPHAHLDKALTADLVPNPGGDLRGAIDSWIENSHLITPEETQHAERGQPSTASSPMASPLSDHTSTAASSRERRR